MSDELPLKIKNALIDIKSYNYDLDLSTCKVCRESNRYSKSLIRSFDINGKFNKYDVNIHMSRTWGGQHYSINSYYDNNFKLFKINSQNLERLRESALKIKELINHLKKRKIVDSKYKKLDTFRYTIITCSDKKNLLFYRYPGQTNIDFIKEFDNIIEAEQEIKKHILISRLST